MLHVTVVNYFYLLTSSLLYGYPECYSSVTMERVGLLPVFNCYD